MNNKQIVADLNKLSIGYGNNKTIGLNFIPGYYAISEGDYESLKKKGQYFCSFICKINNLYKNAIKENDAHLLTLLESGILRHSVYRDQHRRLFTENKIDIPVLFRGDTTNLQEFCEFHVGYRGLGYCCGFRKIWEQYFDLPQNLHYSRLQHVIKKYAADLQQNISKIVFARQYGRKYALKNKEIDLFIQEAFGDSYIKRKKDEITRELKRSRCLSNDNSLPIRYLFISPKDPYVLSMTHDWISYFNQLLFRRCHNTVNQYLAGAALLEPEPNLLFSQKSITTLPYDERYSDLFTDDERKLFPRTYIIEKDRVYHFKEKKMTLDDIVALPRSKCTYIVKYAGLDLKKHSSGRAVYRLRKKNKKQVIAILEHAVKSYELYKEPWVIQEDISEKENVTYYDINEHEYRNARAYRLFRPFFMYDKKKGSIEIVDIYLTFREHDFCVSLNEDSIFGLADLIRNEN